MSSQPRAASLLADKQNPFVNTIKEAMHKYLGDVKVTYHSSDKRDPDFVFYDITKATLNVYRYIRVIFYIFLIIL